MNLTSMEHPPMPSTASFEEPTTAEAETLTLSDLCPGLGEVNPISAPGSSENQFNCPETPGSSNSRTLRDSLTATLLQVLLGNGNNDRSSRKTWKPSMSTILGTGGFVVACVTLWYTISATSDGRKSKILAEWTAKKDFLEFCQSVSSEFRLSIPRDSQHLPWLIHLLC